MIGAGGEVKRSHLIRDNLENLYTLGPGMDKPETNVEKIRRMKKLLSVAMEFSLTDRQKEIVEMYYIEDKGAAQIAVELGISRQAVHKTISQARRKLEKIKIFLKV